ncbi:uncharacterized protein LOC116203076 isoform X1 [Punica granatum]|uniref:Uncharacterized protein LOC116203076 isoform X1 n=1 Tax=Punica granatum TaxID=22663 RepID=A0A6P8D2I2_PUNGR|nr:uncharacterized protein LOC116203076 isoform X1 [Punica granatum]
MTEEKREIIPPKYDLDAKWDECVDLTVRRFVYTSLAGAFGGLLLFRSPVSRWAAVAFGAGVGIGSAYTECSQKFDGFPTKFAPPAPKVSDTPAPKTVLQNPGSQEGQE